MNILILTTHINTGGITSYLLTLSKGLVETGNRVFLVSSGGNREEDFKRIGVECIERNIRTKSELSPKLYMAIPGLKKFIKNNDIDIIHSNTRVTQVLGKLLSFMTEKAFVSTCHGFFKTRLSRKIFPCWGDAVIAISSQVERHLVEDFSVEPKKVFMIKNGIDLKDFSAVKDDNIIKVREGIGLTKNDLAVGIVARLSDVKGHKVLIDAFVKVAEKIEDVKLVIAGEGKEEANLKDQVKNLKLQDHVIFAPSVNGTAEFLKIFDIFVMPSLQEGLGLSVMEAQAVGLPVVASKVGGIPSLIEDGKTGKLVEPNNSAELSDAIIDLLLDKDAASKIGENARKFVEDECSSAKMVDEIVSVYSKVIKK